MLSRKSPRYHKIASPRVGARLRKVGPLTVKSVNEETPTPLAFGITVYGDLDLAVVLFVRASVDGRKWKNVSYEFLIYVIEDEEVVSSPISGFGLEDGKSSGDAADVLSFAKYATRVVCAAIGKGLLDIYAARGSVVNIDDVKILANSQKGRILIGA